MNDVFTMRVRAASVAAWWCVLVAMGFALLLWLVYLQVMTARPAWVLSLWGPEIGWRDLQHIFLWVIVAFRFVVWLLVLASVWLTLWARQLRRRMATDQHSTAAGSERGRDSI